MVSGFRQRDYSIRDGHISGLAAPDAREPAVMIGGFVALGGSMVLFGQELHRRLGSRARPGVGPALVASAGVCTTLAGILRRDRMANWLPGETEPYRQSAINDAHDRFSVAAQACGLAATFALSRRFRNEPGLEAMRRPMIGLALVTGGLAVYFASETARPGNGIAQRVGVTLSLGGMVALAARMLRSPPSCSVDRGNRPIGAMGLQSID